MENHTKWLACSAIWPLIFHYSTVPISKTYSQDIPITCWVLSTTFGGWFNPKVFLLWIHDQTRWIWCRRSKIDHVPWKTHIAIEECYLIVDLATRNDDFPKLCEFIAEAKHASHPLPWGKVPSAGAEHARGHFGLRSELQRFPGVPWTLWIQLTTGLLSKSIILRIGPVYVYKTLYIYI